MSYKIKFSKKAIKQLEKLDVPTKKIIKNWMDINLKDTSNPRKVGKQLKGELSHYRRYRIGQYRLIVDIIDDELVIIAVQIAHRKSIYQKLK